MKMSEIFPSKYLRAADLQGREVKVVMDRVEVEQVGQDTDDTKPVLYFKGKDRGLVLNKTNNKVISEHYGDESEDWYDQPLILFSAMVTFQGQTGPAIRCRIPTAKDNRPLDARRFGSTAKRGADDPISSGKPSDFPGDRELNDDVPGF